MIGWFFAAGVVTLVAWRAAARDARHQAEAKELQARLLAAGSRLKEQRHGQAHDFSKAVAANRRAEAGAATRQKVAAQRSKPKASRSSVTSITQKRKVG